MGYGPLAYLKGPSLFWARINPEYAKKRIAIYCDMENLYCNTFGDTPGIFISVYYYP